jgi:hypothetical protein
MMATTDRIAHGARERPLTLAVLAVEAGHGRIEHRERFGAPRPMSGRMSAVFMFHGCTLIDECDIAPASPVPVVSDVEGVCSSVPDASCILRADNP